MILTNPILTLLPDIRETADRKKITLEYQPGLDSQILLKGRTQFLGMIIHNEMGFWFVRPGEGFLYCGTNQGGVNAFLEMLGHEYTQAFLLEQRIDREEIASEITILTAWELLGYVKVVGDYWELNLLREFPETIEDIIVK